jgi:hypothetical protein
MTLTNPAEELDKRIDAIEAGYEFFLAYAAQGRASDRDAKGAASSLRQHLGSMAEALSGDVVRRCAAARDPEWPNLAARFFAAIDDDAGKASGALRLVLAQKDISSQLIDNLNASIHLRALLTDIFVVDEALKQRVAAS